MIFLQNVTPIKYSSDPPYEIPSQQDNEVHDIIFHYGYKWHTEIQKVTICTIIILIQFYNFHNFNCQRF